MKMSLSTRRPTKNSSQVQAAGSGERGESSMSNTAFRSPFGINFDRNRKRRIDRQLDSHDTHFEGIKEKLSKALELLEGCGEVYRAAPEHIKRAFNQAFTSFVLGMQRTLSLPAGRASHRTHAVSPASVPVCDPRRQRQNKFHNP